MFDNVWIVALLTFGVCGLVGILVDFDHFIARYFFKRKDMDRFLHKYVLILSIIAICVISALLGRYVLG